MGARLMILVMALGLSAPALAAGAGLKGGLDRMVKELNLSEEQKQQVRDIKKKSGEGIKGLKSQVRDAMKDLAQSLRAPEKGDAYRATLTQKFENVQKLRQEMMTKRFQMALEIREILTPTQIEKFRAMDKGGFGDWGKKRHRHDEDDKDGL